MNAHRVRARPRALAVAAGVMAVSAGAPSAVAGQTPELPRVPAITLEAARAVAATARSEATAGGWRMVVVVVDAGGHPVLLERMDGVQLGSVDIALEKARGAVRFRRPTAETAAWVQGGGVHLLGLPGLVPVAGGVPLVVDGVVIGAVGVSGATAAEDDEVARAAAGALARFR